MNWKIKAMGAVLIMIIAATIPFAADAQESSDLKQPFLPDKLRKLEERQIFVKSGEDFVNLHSVQESDKGSLWFDFSLSTNNDLEISMRYGGADVNERESQELLLRFLGLVEYEDKNNNSNYDIYNDKIISNYPLSGSYLNSDLYSKVGEYKDLEPDLNVSEILDQFEEFQFADGYDFGFETGFDLGFKKGVNDYTNRKEPRSSLEQHLDKTLIEILFAIPWELYKQQFNDTANGVEVPPRDVIYIYYRAYVLGMDSGFTKGYEYGYHLEDEENQISAVTRSESSTTHPVKSDDSDANDKNTDGMKVDTTGTTDKDAESKDAPETESPDTLSVDTTGTSEKDTESKDAPETESPDTLSVDTSGTTDKDAESEDAPETESPDTLSVDTSGTTDKDAESEDASETRDTESTTSDNISLTSNSNDNVRINIDRVKDLEQYIPDDLKEGITPNSPSYKKIFVERVDLDKESYEIRFSVMDSSNRFGIACTVVNDFSWIDNGYLSPGSLKVDLLINDYPFKKNGTSLALLMDTGMITDSSKKVTFDRDEDSYDESIKLASDEAMIKISTEGFSGFFSWTTSALADERPIEVGFSDHPSFLGSEWEIWEGHIEHFKGVVFSYPRAFKIEHDPKLGFIEIGEDNIYNITSEEISHLLQGSIPLFVITSVLVAVAVAVTWRRRGR